MSDELIVPVWPPGRARWPWHRRRVRLLAVGGVLTILFWVGVAGWNQRSLDLSSLDGPCFGLVLVNGHDGPGRLSPEGVTHFTRQIHQLQPSRNPLRILMVRWEHYGENATGVDLRGARSGALAGDADVAGFLVPLTSRGQARSGVYKYSQAGNVVYVQTPRGSRVYITDCSPECLNARLSPYATPIKELLKAMPDAPDR